MKVRTSTVPTLYLSSSPSDEDLLVLPHALVPAQGTGASYHRPPTNRLVSFTILIALNHPDASPSWKGNYCFSDPQTDLVGEPLLDDATAAIKEISEQHYGKVIKAFTVDFTDDFGIAEGWMNEPIQPLILSLDDPTDAPGGTRYTVAAESPREIREIVCLAGLVGNFVHATLCPMLLRYFDEPPKELYCRFSPEAA